MTTEHDLTEAVDAAADLLAHHAFSHVNADGWAVCLCGHVCVDDDDDGSHARHQAAVVVPVLAARVRAEALREAADAWQRGAWADTPRRPDRVVERIAASQYVGDWLRRRAAASTGEAGRG